MCAVLGEYNGNNCAWTASIYYCKKCEHTSVILYFHILVWTILSVILFTGRFFCMFYFYFYSRVTHPLHINRVQRISRSISEIIQQKPSKKINHQPYCFPSQTSIIDQNKWLQWYLQGHRRFSSNSIGQ